MCHLKRDAPKLSKWKCHRKSKTSLRLVDVWRYVCIMQWNLSRASCVYQWHSSRLDSTCLRRNIVHYISMIFEIFPFLFVLSQTYTDYVLARFRAAANDRMQLPLYWLNSMQFDERRTEISDFSRLFIARFMWICRPNILIEFRIDCIRRTLFTCSRCVCCMADVSEARAQPSIIRTNLSCYAGRDESKRESLLIMLIWYIPIIHRRNEKKNFERLCLWLLSTVAVAAQYFTYSRLLLLLSRCYVTPKCTPTSVSLSLSLFLRSPSLWFRLYLFYFFLFVLFSLYRRLTLFCFLFVFCVCGRLILYVGKNSPLRLHTTYWDWTDCSV